MVPFWQHFINTTLEGECDKYNLEIDICSLIVYPYFSKINNEPELLTAILKSQESIHFFFFPTEIIHVLHGIFMKK